MLRNRPKVEGLAALLREWRLESQLTQAEAAAVLKVSRRTYQGWESGANAPRPMHLRRITATLPRREAA